jgi:hypothetical protein
MTDRRYDDELDALLEHALAGYTPAEPRAGFDERLHARLAGAVPVEVRGLRVMTHWAWAACALLAFSLAIVAIHPHRQTRTEAKVKPAPAARPGPADAAPGAQAEAASPIQPALRAAAPRRPRRAAPANGADEASRSEMRAPSRPAPQAPLTAEEKLLLRVVHRCDPGQLAMLNPEERASRAAESDKEFQNFVDQSRSGNE